MRDTSLQAYQQLQPRLGELQQIVLVFINAYPDSTDRELAEKIGRPDPNFVRPRRFELVDLGYVECSGKRVCKISGKIAHTWRVRK
jgi:hypothetical protein